MIGAVDKRLVGLTRSVRAAIVVPSLFAFALLIIKRPEAAGAAVLGTFAHLVLVDYDAAGDTRFGQSAKLTLFGTLVVSLGTLASASVWLAVGATIGVGFLFELPAVAKGRLAAIRRA